MKKNKTPLVIGNWKMNNTPAKSKQLAQRLKKNLKRSGKKANVVVCPSFTNLSVVEPILKGSKIKLGAQNMFWKNDGAYTGEISASMLKAFSCKYVIIGHSERRINLGETDQMINKKIKLALKSGLTPIVCIGENLATKKANLARSFVKMELTTAFKNIPLKKAKIVIAYEPIWAIGTGKSISPVEAEEMHNFINKLLTKYANLATIRSQFSIVYGGSVSSKNMPLLMSQPSVDGVLVGGASLKVQEFSKIVEQAA